MILKKVAIIGSFDQLMVIDKLEQACKLCGYDEVWRPIIKSGQTPTKYVEECFDNISKADKIIVVKNVDGSLKLSTAYELVFALMVCKKEDVWFYNPTDESYIYFRKEEEKL